jgi:hypothetical protein
MRLVCVKEVANPIPDLCKDVLKLGMIPKVLRSIPSQRKLFEAPIIDGRVQTK